MKDTDFRKAVGKGFRKARVMRGFSISQACDGSGVAESTICRIENGRHRVALADAARLAVLYGMSLDHLAGVETATVATIHVLGLLNPRALGLLGIE